MKQFNLEEYLRMKEEGKEPKIVTREGSPIRILCTDRNDKEYPVVGMYENGSIEVFMSDGIWQKGDRSIHDLFFAPTKHEGWMNIYPSIGFKNVKSIGGDIYTTEQRALELKSSNCIATVKVEWYE